MNAFFNSLKGTLKNGSSLTKLIYLKRNLRGGIFEEPVMHKKTQTSQK
jgi:hypothetical protein